MKEKDVVEALLDVGLTKGAITCKEIDDLLPLEIFPVERLEALVDLLYSMGIRITGFEEYAT